LFWKKYKNPLFINIPSNYPANCIAFTSDNKYAVAGGPRVTVYGAGSKASREARVNENNKRQAVDDFDDLEANEDDQQQVVPKKASNSELEQRNVSCADVALATCFRADGKMLIVGGGRGMLKVVANSSAKSTVRNFSGEAGKQDIRAVAWSLDGGSVYAGGDDGTLRIFNVDTSECTQLKGHTDSIRAIATNVLSQPNLIATCSYDHTIKIWDLTEGVCTHTLNHGYPVECIELLPSNTLLVSCGSTRVKTWSLPVADSEGGGAEPLSTTIAHTKSITALTITAYTGAGDSAAAPVRIVTGGADGHVNIYDAITMKVVHGWKYQAAVTAVAISPDKKTVVVGCTDGVVYIKSRDDTEFTAETRKKSKPRPGTYSYFMRGGNEVVDESDYLVFVDQKKSLKAYDKHLKTFNYSKALDSALLSRNPQIICQVLVELKRREGIVSAVSGRDSAELESLLSFIQRYLPNQRYTQPLVSLMDTIVTVYGPDLKREDILNDLVGKIRDSVRAELETQKAMGRLVGAIEGIICSAELASLQQQQQFKESFTS
jgi:U3 small nucleolar RNA-associated protein 15